MSAEGIVFARSGLDRIPLTQLQARRLALLTRIDAAHFAGRCVAEIAETYRWQIDPRLFQFRRVYCRPPSPVSCVWIPGFEMEWMVRPIRLVFRESPAEGPGGHTSSTGSS